ncbi:MAG: hypothetical protein U0736_18850 [Gemmataceae bacterium]
MDRFLQAVRDGRPPECDLPRACALDWLRAARKSRTTGWRMLLAEST